MTILPKVIDLIGNAAQVPERAAEVDARKELADAKAVHAALQQKPDWARQPNELDQAAQLVNELEAVPGQAAAAVHEARQAKRQAMYPAAAREVNAERDALAELAPLIAAQYRAAVTAVAHLLEQVIAYQGRAEGHSGAARTLRHLAEEHRENDLLPEMRTAPVVPTTLTDMSGPPPGGVLDVPHLPVIQEALATLRRKKAR